jgi:hypothetical protein
MAGYTDLPYDEDVERKSEFLRDFVRYRYAAAWKCEHDGIAVDRHTTQDLRKAPPGVLSVVKEHGRANFALPRVHRLRMSTEKRHDTPNLEQNQEERRKAVIDEVSRENAHADRDTEAGAPMAPHQNREPREQHRGGPLPNHKR